MQLNVEKIRSARKGRGLRQQDLATMAGVGLRTISRVEKNGHVPSSDRLIKIADVLGIDPTELFTAEDAA